jgi:hypothetical protein
VLAGNHQLRVRQLELEWPPVLWKPPPQPLGRRRIARTVGGGEELRLLLEVLERREGRELG